MWLILPVDDAATVTMFVVGGTVLLVAMVCLLSRKSAA
jgi:hypothetical protein